MHVRVATNTLQQLLKYHSQLPLLMEKFNNKHHEHIISVLKLKTPLAHALENRGAFSKKLQVIRNSFILDDEPTKYTSKFDQR